jgi:WD40 repeat protein
VAIAFSNNGYHLATAHKKASTVRVWDLRKQKTLAILNNADDSGITALKSVVSLGYDDSGKYLAYGGAGGLHVTTVKEWGITAQLPLDHIVSSLVWASNNDQKWIATCSSQERMVRFHGK